MIDKYKVKENIWMYQMIAIVVKRSKTKHIYKFFRITYTKKGNRIKVSNNQGKISVRDNLNKVKK